MEPQHATTAAPNKIDWKRAVLAGLIATVVITVTMALFGQNIAAMLGGMIAPDASTGTQYALGGMMHLAVGLAYGLLYAWLLGPVRAHGRTLKGVLYGAALAGIALAVMPAASAMIARRLMFAALERKDSPLRRRR
jgi:MFS-type transporter involved in bile tolerance (Atg22 family)